jgi:catechol 2,3-dioxygenase-like lactoylglutathione lyase family enzyme
MTQRLHHMAFRCRDTEETRAFYEEVIGLPLVGALAIQTTATGRQANVLHTFFKLRDGSHIAFFEEPDEPFAFKDQRDFDLHLALEADDADVERANAAAAARGIETRGPSNHGFIRSTYYRDPNGYVVELAVKTPAHSAFERDGPAEARRILADWNAAKAERQSEPA